MLYYDFEAGGTSYKLRLNTRNIVALEKVLGVNPIAIFGTGNVEVIPTLTQMVAILHASLQQYNHGITLDNAYTIFDSWIDDGHEMTDFFSVIIEVYKVSGLFKKGEETEKN